MRNPIQSNPIDRRKSVRIHNIVPSNLYSSTSKFRGDALSPLHPSPTHSPGVSVNPPLGFFSTCLFPLREGHASRWPPLRTTRRVLRRRDSALCTWRSSSSPHLGSVAALCTRIAPETVIWGLRIRLSAPAHDNRALCTWDASSPHPHTSGEDETSHDPPVVCGIRTW